MASIAQASLLSQVLRVLPGRLLSVLDGWSHRVARRRAQERQRKWLQQKAAAERAPAVPGYRLQPWRD